MIEPIILLTWSSHCSDMKLLGGQFHSRAEDISQKGFHAVVETNLYGTWNMMNEAFHQYMKENGGNIVNIVTINRMGMAGMAHSGAARAGVKNLSQESVLHKVPPHRWFSCLKFVFKILVVCTFITHSGG